MTRMFPHVRFVVSGSQRSATGYTATLLTALGCACGHEAIFNADRLRRHWLAGRQLGVLLRIDPHREFLTPGEITVTEVPMMKDGPQGEASWLAAPYLARLPAGTVVLHQVRDPLAVIRSMIRSRFFQESTHRTFAAQHCPPVAAGTLLDRLMTYWVEWNSLVASAAGLPHLHYHRFRVEDLTPDLLAEIARRIDIRYDPDRAREVWAALPRDINTRGAKWRDEAVRWETLPSGAARRRLASLAHVYGYSTA